MSKITLNDTFPVYFQLMSKYVHANNDMTSLFDCCLTAAQ